MWATLNHKTDVYVDYIFFGNVGFHVCDSGAAKDLWCPCKLIIRKVGIAMNYVIARIVSFWPQKWHQILWISPVGSNRRISALIIMGLLFTIALFIHDEWVYIDTTNPKSLQHLQVLLTNPWLLEVVWQAHSCNDNTSWRWWLTQGTWLYLGHCQLSTLLAINPRMMSTVWTHSLSASWHIYCLVFILH